MKTPTLSSETLHASCVALDGRAVLIAGASGKGKSDLALRLIDRGARLVSDDYVIVKRAGGRLVASAPPNIRGRMEVRGIGIVEFEPEDEVPVSLFVDLDGDVARLPSGEEKRVIAGIGVPLVAMHGLEASAPVKLEHALEKFGLPRP
jgi:serine kinase of HPr protein (carbohydrate metabolism regulator)